MTGSALRPPARSVLAINGGSSSIKFGVFTFDATPTALSRGLLDEPPSAAAFDRVLARVADPLQAAPLAAIGHRIVHGGAALTDPQLVTPALIAALQELVPFAPNHLTAEIALIEAAAQSRPDVPQFACFDTAFHAGLPDVARRLPIPRRYDEQGIRRYGFHGLSFTYLLGELRRRGGNRQGPGRVVLLHLGNGSSVAAVRDGRSVDSSMGFTPLGGVVMSSRPGDLDPGVVTAMARVSGFDPDQLEHELSHASGLKGISGGRGDMRELLAREPDDTDCRLAVAVFCYEILKRIGAYAAVLGGLDALVFSGGIGEHAAIVRARICAGLGFLGVSIDEDANRDHRPVISTSNATVTVHVIPTDEEVVIAAAGHALLVP